MSLFGSAILERLHNDSPASNPENDFYKVFDGSVGEWLDRFDVDRFHEQLFVGMASGEWLDLHGEEYGVKRKLDESDSDYRERIVKHTLGDLTPSLLGVDFGLEVFTDVNGYTRDGNKLVSDNPYISRDGYIVFCDDETRALVEKSFVLNEAIRWFAP